ncbi:MAG TPA: B12-binding domain-containing radical SAM protein, partial [Candidatus Hypogeohydataceae bacterium YC40]
MKLFRLVIPKFPYFNVYSRIKMPPRGAVSVATTVNSLGEFKVEIIDENNFSGPLDHNLIQKERPADAVGLYGGLTSTIPRLYEVASFYQGLGVPTVAGGNHINACVEEALSSGVDVVIMGEGEYTLPEAVKAIFYGKDLSAVSGICFKKGNQTVYTKRRPPIQDLDSLPYPDFSLIRDLQSRIMLIPLGRTRGCNFVCEFCAVNQHLGHTRSSSPGYVMEEIVRLVEKGYRNFFFTDDNFAQDRDTTAELCKMIAEYKRKTGKNLSFCVQVRADVAKDKEILELMREADVEILCIGYESPIEEDLKNMKKGLNLQKLDEYTQTLKKYGFYIHGMFILGYPTFKDSRCKLNISMAERVERFWQFIKRNDLDTVQIVKPVPLPGTGLEKKLKDENRLYPVNLVDYSKYDGNWLCFEPDADIDPHDFLYQTEKLVKKFYNLWIFPKLLYQVPLYPLEVGIRFLGAFFKELRAGKRDSLGSLLAKSFSQ